MSLAKAETKEFYSELLGESYTLTKHPSGLSVYVFPKKMVTTFAMMAVDFGSIDNVFDGEGKEKMPDGVAHFLEHKLFTNEDGSDSLERFSALGADANAFTAHTKTVYLFSATDRVEEALEELVTFTSHPYFPAESVEREKGIIGEEIHMCRDNPYDRCYYNILRGLYHNHPIRREICGSVTSIGDITSDTLYRAYNAYYRYSNMALAVCGDVEKDTVLRVVDKCLAKQAPTPSVPRRIHKEPPTAYRPYTEEYGVVSKPIFTIGFKDVDLPREPLERIRRDAAVSVLNEMLFSQSGEFYNSLLDRGMISPDFSTDYVFTADFAFNQLMGEAENPKAVAEEVKHYLTSVMEKGLKEEDFERCRRVEYAEYIKGFDSTEEIANTLLSFAAEGADLFCYSKILEEMTLSDLEKLLPVCFSPAAMTLSVVAPYPAKNDDGGSTV